MADPNPSVQPGQKRDPGPFAEHNTDLGKFSHGNFDVAYRPSDAELVITFKAKFEFESGIPIYQQQEMRNGFQAGIAMWNNSGIYMQTANAEALNEIIRFHFELVETNSGYHKIIDVARNNIRPWVFMDLNISIDWRYDIKTLAHEMGHVFGNYDEYGGTGFLGWLERRMWWHDNRFLHQTDALMNSGTTFYPRYFDHFQRFVNKHFEDLGIQYDLVQGPPTSLPVDSSFLPMFFGEDPPRDRRMRGVAHGYYPVNVSLHQLPGPHR